MRAGEVTRAAEKHTQKFKNLEKKKKNNGHVQDFFFFFSLKNIFFFTVQNFFYVDFVLFCFFLLELGGKSSPPWEEE